MKVLPVPCACGQGCKGTPSSTNPAIRSERDAVAVYLKRHGPMPVYASDSPPDADPLYWIESVDDPRVDKDPPTHRQVRAQAAQADPLAQQRQSEALAWIEAYRGSWGLPLDIGVDRRWGTSHMRLSERQVEVILAAKARDAARDEERGRSQTGRDLTVLPVGRTLAAVDNDEGHLTFLAIDRPKAGSKWEGWAFVRQVLGGRSADEGRRIGSQRPGQTYVGEWTNLIDRVLADPVAAVERYGAEMGVCGVCGRTLTNEESREGGIGPVCRVKLTGGL